MKFKLPVWLGGSENTGKKSTLKPETTTTLNTAQGIIDPMDPANKVVVQNKEGLARMTRDANDIMAHENTGVGPRHEGGSRG